MTQRHYRPSLLRSLGTPLTLPAISMFFAALTLLALPFSKMIAHWMPRIWSGIWLWMGGARVTLQGAAQLDPAKRYVFVCNHQSGLDIPVLYVALHHWRLSFMSKKELMLIPLFGWGMAAIGHIAVDRSNARKAHVSIQKALNHMRRGRNSLVVFPEGTRSPDGRLQSFKTGVFNLALEMGVPLVPIALCGSSRVLRKHSLRYRPGPVTVRVGAPLCTEGVSRADKREIAATLHERIAGMLAGDDADAAERQPPHA